MNTSRIQSYATQARRDFLKAVTERANYYGILGDDQVDPLEFKGDVAIVGDRVFSYKEGRLREQLVERIEKNGFEMTMRAAAYTWFNRLVAIRYMELHDFLGHGFRVLGNPDQSAVTFYPEILEHATDLDLPGLDKEEVVRLRLAGDRDNELYRLLLIAQCHELYKSMPFLFDSIDSETELLLPDNLLHTDSPIRKLVTEIPEEDWQDVEIIGWIYQFYISERKSQVMGKVVPSQDIPAATQLFTPNWIVKYMVQNTLGRMWLATYPDSPLREKMEYYIEPAEQEPEVEEKLAEITPRELNPEKITFMDPACGSGHILVEAYDLLKEIYLERGYRTREIPRLILENNLYGLDIDDRAAQLAGFAVLMRARADDRRILKEGDLELNIMSIQSTASLDADDLAKKISEGIDVDQNGLVEFIRFFQNAKTFGSLISVPEHIAEQLDSFNAVVQGKLSSNSWYASDAAQILQPIVKQAMMLAGKCDCVVTNPPYMGNKGMNPELKNFAKNRFPAGKSDLFAMFIERNLGFASEKGYVAMITMQSWMFLSSFEKLRDHILEQKTIFSMAHLGPRAFDSIGGEVVSTTTFVLSAAHHKDFKGRFVRLVEENSEIEKKKELRNCISKSSFHLASAADLDKIPGSPIAYWVSGKVREIFAKNPPINEYAIPRQGFATGHNDTFLRNWYEVSVAYIRFGCENRSDAIACKQKWFPCNKGGPFRKWYGNNLIIVNWKNDGEQMKAFRGSVIRNQDSYFKEGITWSTVSSSNFSVRYSPEGFLFETKGSVCFPVNNNSILYLLGLLNTKVINTFLHAISPTIDFHEGPIGSIPLKIWCEKGIIDLVTNLLESERRDWDSYETSWYFTILPLLKHEHHQPTLKATYTTLRRHWRERTLEMQRLEEENNRIFIEAYGLQDELTPEVPISEITLTCNPYYRYGANKTEEELESLLQTDTMKELISYSIGCMMGRYSLDEPGLVYAHSGNTGFDPSRYQTFPADDDGIIPIMDMDWFADDAANRFIEFLKVAWPEEALEENLQFVADSLKTRRNEEPGDTIRRYLSTSFFKDHLKMYKKRPIYWLFSSGKNKAFECLVYLHRYNESTLSRMRSSYVTPLQGNIRARIDYLREEKDSAASVSDKRKIEKRLETLKKKQAELAEFDDKLRHYADMRIALDLDDGVKVNYGKFGDLLAETKAVTGSKG
ncbi:MAG: BREX-1 system adenine-specific DNA-methyltransferase PglX [Desulfurivibrionaceae bacterium]